MIIADLHSQGISPTDIKELNTIANGSAKYGASFFHNKDGMPSGPQEVFGLILIFLITFIILAAVKLTLSNDADTRNIWQNAIIGSAHGRKISV